MDFYSNCNVAAERDSLIITEYKYNFYSPNWNCYESSFDSPMYE